MKNLKFRFLQNKKIFIIFIFGILLRLFFLHVGAERYYGSLEASVSNGDTGSYVNSFLNLLHHGCYTFDFNEPDAAFGRLPGYPFFFGIHYLVFGPHYAMQATAYTQLLLDSSAILLVFSILNRLVPQRPSAAYIGAVLYATYPFSIIWITIIGTESLAIFLILFWLNTLVHYKSTWIYSLCLGILCAVCFYVREYLGILLPISLFYLLIKHGFGSSVARRTFVRSGLLVSLGFLILYMWWPVRNYTSFHRVMFLKPTTAGYANYKSDLIGFRNWLHCWTNDEQTWLDSAVYAKQITYPRDIFASDSEQRAAIYATEQGRQYGTSFQLYLTKRYGQPTYRTLAERRVQDERNAAIGATFDALRMQYKAHFPFKYWLHTPMLNIYKAFFKSTKQQPGNQKNLIAGLFLYRSILLLLGVLGLIVFRRQSDFWPVLMFWLFMYLFISFVMRNLEMRYLLQADVMMLIPASALLSTMIGRFYGSKPLQAL